MVDDKKVINDKVSKFKNSKILGVSQSNSSEKFKEAAFNLIGALESRGVVLGDKSGAFEAAAAGAELRAKNNNDKQGALDQIALEKFKESAVKK